MTFQTKKKAVYKSVHNWLYNHVTHIQKKLNICKIIDSIDTIL